ncbi:MoaD/ThiS family protein [Arcobacter sp. FWKO B]|uniref:MoaD/ThiS family protein n=1 Tax=Arcobacter sp. FWKO B TaxID=2593672 RepID=UPI0018A50E29|nr:MoaD/ThiS family protein [Arcobacter sp. FWKO B]QOG12663.1 MoaD/ThiS family protein [Arcobacter sp. FWKO B]
MVKVEFLGPISKEPMELDIKSLDELSVILKDDLQVSSWLNSCAVALNDKIINSRDVVLQSGDKISLLPPVCGG